MRRTVAVAVAGVALVLTVSACSGSDPDMPGLTASPTATTTPTPTPTPTPTSTSVAGTVVDLSDPELGIVFEDLPDLSGDEADVYNWMATYRLEYWRTMRTNQPSPAFSVFTSPELAAEMARLAAENTADGWTVDGTFRVTIDDIVVNGDTATARTCDDYSGVTVTATDGPVSLQEAGVDVPLLLDVTLARTPTVDGLWTVLTTTGAGTC